jgi:CheY-like chemotaxis protein
MDCQMPQVDGFEAARRIRSAATGVARPPIVAVTANVLPGYREICLAAGMSDYLPKPALLEPLTRIIDRWLPAYAGPVTKVEPAAHIEPAGAEPMTAARARLRTIFRGDETRVEATIALAMRSLDEGTSDISAALETRDERGAAEAAHKLKGVAVEIGLLPVAEVARALEERAKAGDWAGAHAAYDRLRTAIARAAAPEDGPA